MSKREALYEEARRLYVIHGLSRLAIAGRLGVSARSLQTWSTDNLDGKGAWDEQKAKLVDGDEAFHAELMALGAVVARKIKDDMLNNTLDPKQVSALDRIVKVAINAWKYDQKNPKTAAPTSAADRQKAIGGQIREKLGLVRR
jgi:hypothetical protein